MKIVLVIMTGIGFTLGVVFGLLLQLPIDNTLPADSAGPINHRLSGAASFRSRRSLSEAEEKLQLQQQQQLQIQQQLGNSAATSSDELLTLEKSVNGKISQTLGKQKIAVAESNPLIGSEQGMRRPNNEQIDLPREVLQQSANRAKENRLGKQSRSETVTFGPEGKFHNSHTADLVLERGSDPMNEVSGRNRGLKPENNNSKPSNVVTLRLNVQKDKKDVKNKVPVQTLKRLNSHSPEDVSYLASIVSGVHWTPQLEKSCPKPFHSEGTEAWRRRAQDMDVVKMEEGCGRMQNRLVTFRDASKACARYRLNTDQIQGEIFSYYLARLLNISNIPPTVLVQVDALASKWRTVHLQLSLAQWADSKLVVLTQHIDGLSPAHIPVEFREEGRRLEPTLAGLGSKSHSELCELVQWSDLIVFDYLTANLDRVINNMFNRQWNDQMMSSPAHNLEQLADGSLVFLDNESGLFHGYRLLDKYAGFHRSLLSALCVFRPSTAAAVKRLHESSNIGDELHALFSANEALHRQIAAIPEKNLKILQQRLADVHAQIVSCERLFDR